MKTFQKKHCCSRMTSQINKWSCDQHKDQYECPDAIIDYSSKFDEYGIIIHDGGTSSIAITNCPWCGLKLPESKRDLWFDTLENLGFENLFSNENLPAKFETGEWYKEL